MEKTHWKKNFNYDFLGTYSLPNGQDIILTISNITQKEVVGGNGKKDLCTIAEFKEGVKPMILNRTNCKTLTKLYNTPYIEDWVGKKIQVYAQKNIKVGNDTTEGLRIREYEPKVFKLDVTQQLKEMNACKTLEELRVLYDSFTIDVKNDRNVIQLKETLKSTLK